VNYFLLFIFRKLKKQVLPEMNKQIEEMNANINREIESLFDEIEELYIQIMEKRFELEKSSLDLTLALEANFRQDFQRLSMDYSHIEEKQGRDS